MAESAVSFLLDKLGTVLNEKVKLIKNVKREVEYVRDELERMTAFLRVADATEDSDPELKVWVKQVREVAFETEDIIDDFMLQQPLIYSNGCCSVGFSGLLYKLMFCVKRLKTQYQIASEIKDIKSRMSLIAEGHNRYRYKFNAPNQSSNSSSSTDGSSDRRGDALLLEETELVGIEIPKRKLVSLLVEGESRLMVVAVAGMGGLGKTTLAKQVFDDLSVKKHFHSEAWITVSQTFKVEELLKDTIQQLFDQMKLPLPQDLSSMNGNRLKATIKEFLRQRRYVLVFDDVWSVQAWETIKHVLPNGDQGSRVVLTTRVVDVALACTIETSGNVFPLKPLSEEESWTLFCRKAFHGNSCPPHLIEICENILKRCGGLPLAIVAISGVLSTKKDTNIDEWKMLNDGLGTELEGNDQLESMKSILLLSFNYLPYYLKPCFMYLSIYPEDHVIERSTTIRQWISEGFIKPKEGRTLEEVAQSYLNELINRSLIRPIRSNVDGSVREGQIHDLYREIILSKSREQNLVTITSEWNMAWPMKARRLAVHGALEEADVRRYGSRLCSILLFGVNDSKSVSSILQLIKLCRMLKVLDLRGLPIENFPEAILELFHLKYLCLRNTLIKKLPGSIAKLRKLEMLDLKGTQVTELPVEILKLENLRQLVVFRYYDWYPHLVYNYVSGFKALRGIGLLTSLQKLSLVEAYPGSNIFKEIASLTELNRLGVTMLRSEDCVSLCSSIAKLHKLSSLFLRAVEGDVLELNHLSTPPPFLQRLYLLGRLAKFPRWIHSLTGLTRVYFRWSQLTDDPLEYLEDLPNLIHLEFLEGYIGQEMLFNSGKFPKLKLLGLDKLENLKRVIIEKGAMPLLEKFLIQRCKLLESVPAGIERLTNLKVLEFFDMPEEFISPISPETNGEEYWKVAHIPEVHHAYWKNGCWEVYQLEGQQPTDEELKKKEGVARMQAYRNWLLL